MDYILIYDPISRFVWTITIVVLLLFSIQFLRKALGRDNPKVRNILYGYFFVMFGQCLTRLFLFIADYFIIGEFQGQSFYGHSDIVQFPFHWMIFLAYLCSFCSLTFAFYYFERGVSSSHRFSLISLFLVGYYIFITRGFLSRPITQFLGYIAIFVEISLLLMYMTFLSRKSSHEFKTVSGFFFVGYLVYICGLITDSGPIKYLELFPTTFPAFLIMVGAFIQILPMILKADYLSRKLYIWVFSAILSSVLIIIIFGLSSVVEPDERFLLFIWLVSILILILCFMLLLLSLYYIIIILRESDLIIDIDNEEKQAEDYLKLFLKPQEVIKENVVFHKEQKVCLVCRKNISKFIYVCPDCNALYCYKCTNALVKTENSCWICNAAFDDTKPITIQDTSLESENKSKLKKVALVTILNKDFYEKVNRFKWEQDEKEEFIQYMLTLSPQRREEFLNEIINDLSEISLKNNSKNN